MIYTTKHFFFSLFILFVYALSNNVIAQQDYKAELKSIGDSIFKGSTDSVRNASSNRTFEILSELLKNASSFNESFDSVKAISTIYSPDKKIAVLPMGIAGYGNQFVPDIWFFADLQSKKTDS